MECSDGACRPATLRAGGNGNNRLSFLLPLAGGFAVKNRNLDLESGNSSAGILLHLLLPATGSRPGGGVRSLEWMRGMVRGVLALFVILLLPQLAGAKPRRAE